MKTNMKFLVYLVVYKTFILKIVLSLEYVHFDHKCRDIASLIPMLTLNGNLLDECVEQCWLRQDCRSVIFKRLYPICELYNVDVSGLQPARLGTSCTVIRRDDIHLNGTEVCTSYELLRVYTFYYVDGTLTSS